MNPWIPYGLPLDPLWNSYKFPMDSHVHFIVLSARKSGPPPRTKFLLPPRRSGGNCGGNGGNRHAMAAE